MSNPDGKIFSVGLKDRNFAFAVNTSGLKLIPERYSWHAIGGPLSADITVESLGKDSRAIWETLELLRCPVEIYDHHQRCVWWGYVSEVEITVGSFTVGVSIDSMSNRISVLFEASSGLKSVTSWSQDDDSVATYGTKELKLSSQVLGQSAAEYLRNQELRFRAKPIPEISIDGPSNQINGRITCSGWWKSLDWKYYSVASGSAVETTTQIVNIVSACGQFLTGTEIKNTSGHSSDPYRSGENGGLFEIQGLLEAGTSTGSRLLCSINQQRELVVWVEPDLNMSAIDLFIRQDGKAVNMFNVEVNSQCPVGVWARLKDVIPGSLDIGILADPSVFFIEEASYLISEDRYIPVPRGQGTPYGVGTRISEG